MFQDAQDLTEFLPKIKINSNLTKYETLAGLKILLDSEYLFFNSDF